MERTIDVTVTVDEKTGNATIFFCESESGDHFRMSEVKDLNDETAKNVGWEILCWIENLRDEIVWQHENEKED